MPRNELLCQLFGGDRQQWISYKMNIPHPRQVKGLKFWGPFWSYQLNSNANLAIYQEIRQNGLNWQFCLAFSF
jgi:hypothetical protein